MRFAPRQKQSKFSRSAFALTALVISIPFFDSTVPVAAAETAKVQLSGHVDYQAAVLAAAGVTLDQAKLPAKVFNVKLGTEAAYGGLQEGDRITKLEISDSEIKLAISRNGANYLLKMQTPSAARINSALAAKISTTPKIAATLPIDIQKPKTVEEYDVVFLLDKSGSMNDMEQSVGNTRWDWCKKEILSFSALEMKNPNKRFTIGLFSNTWDIRQSCDFHQLQNAFRDNEPGGATDMGDPIQDVLNAYLSGARAKPLLIVVMTDGEPTAGPKVDQVIIDATKRMTKPDEVRIVFLEIGEAFAGEQMLQLLDDQLVSKGAKYDVVSHTTFRTLVKRGLKACMQEALQDNTSTSK